jgi:hypothetical protein
MVVVTGESYCGMPEILMSHGAEPLPAQLVVVVEMITVPIMLVKVNQIVLPFLHTCHVLLLYIDCFLFLYGSIYILEQGSIDLTVGGAPTAHLHICTCGLPRSLQYYYHSSGKSQSMLLPALVFQQQIKIHFDQVRTLFVMFK